jgi:hypothetical protein
MKFALFLLLFPIVVVMVWDIDRNRVLLREVIKLKESEARFDQEFHRMITNLDEYRSLVGIVSTNINWMDHQWRHFGPADGSYDWVEIGCRADGVVVWRKTPAQ